MRQAKHMLDAALVRWLQAHLMLVVTAAKDNQWGIDGVTWHSHLPAAESCRPVQGQCSGMLTMGLLLDLLLIQRGEFM